MAKEKDKDEKRLKKEIERLKEKKAKMEARYEKKYEDHYAKNLETKQERNLFSIALTEVKNRSNKIFNSPSKERNDTLKLVKMKLNKYEAQLREIEFQKE